MAKISTKKTVTLDAKDLDEAISAYMVKTKVIKAAVDFKLKLILAEDKTITAVVDFTE